MKASYRLLALDLDDTLLTNDKKVTEKAKESIFRAKESGVTVTFATGRGRQTVEEYRDELKLLDSPMVLLNGAEVWHDANSILERHFLTKEDIIKLQRLAEEEDAWYWAYSVESLTHKDEWTDDMFERCWMKFGLKHNDLGVIGRIKHTIESWNEFEITSSAPINLEISCKGISKESGVRKICEMMGIEMWEVMAIGDSMNDYKLFQEVGLGVAMSNSDDRLISIADRMTDSNERDGVAKAIEKFLLG